MPILRAGSKGFRVVNFPPLAGDKIPLARRPREILLYKVVKNK
jgi:hypothetical protein